jgi:periplasmic copper chaperone A
MKRIVSPLIAIGAAVALASAAVAQSPALPKVEGAWVRSSVPGQQGTGAFMKLTSNEATQLVGVATPVAGVVQVHEMKLEGEVMRMRAIGKLDLPAGRTVELKPGGYHVMLLDLKQALTQGSTVPMTLSFRNAKGVESRLELKVPVAAKPPGAAAAPMDGRKMEGHKH